MVELVVCTTEDLSAEMLQLVRSLVHDAFEGSFTDQDWDNTVGGIHVLVRENGMPLVHAAVVARWIVAGTRRLSVGYVEGVATARERRRQGHATRAMKTVGSIISRSFDLGALSADVPQLYVSLGWEPWQGHTYVNSPAGRVRSPEDDDGVMVLRTDQTADIDLTSDLTCDWRPGDAW